MNEAITFDDVLIVPQFSTIESRKDVDLSVNRLNVKLKLPIMSANMDTITDHKFAIAMAQNGAVGCLHRFWDIETNLKEFREVFLYEGQQVICSVGLGSKELERAEALSNAGCTSFVIDVANAASIMVVKQLKELRNLLGNNISVVVGNFATGNAVKTFLEYSGSSIDGIKLNIGAGSCCSTRLKTGVGYPQFSSIYEISKILKNVEITIIADGGMNSVADCAKALGAGAHILMSGSLFAGTDETPGETLWKNHYGDYCAKEIVWPKKKLEDGTVIFMDENEFEMQLPAFKKYRGSASKESYDVQGKNAPWRTTEGVSQLVPYKGPLKEVLQDIEGGLRSSFSYVGAKNLKEFHEKVEFVRVSSSTIIENGIRNGVK